MSPKPTASLLFLSLSAVLLSLFFPHQVVAQTGQQPIVQAILFYSPTCPHCHQVITEFLIPLQEQYGEQLQIIGIDTSHPAGGELYGNAIEHFGIPENRQGVPTLIIGQTVLVGSAEIPDQFPALVEESLSAGGIGWPDIPDLAVIVTDLPPSADPGLKPAVGATATVEAEEISQDPEPVPVPTAVLPGDKAPEVAIEETAGDAGEAPTSIPAIQSLENGNVDPVSPERVFPPADPAGFTLAMLVFFGMIMALIYTTWLVIRLLPPSAAVPSDNPNLSWAIPALALIGLVVALYLSYVEITQVEAVCGPVGECNIVQSSPYAHFMGIPVAVLGALSYLAVVTLWFGQRFLPKHLQALSLLSLAALTIVGTGFSLYLTAIEMFIIKAFCAWCLSSAVVTALLMVMVAKTVNNGSLQMKLGTPT